MADAVVRREARRRRILENSENRLQRITGEKSTLREEKLNISHTSSNSQPTDQENEFVPDINAHPDPKHQQNDLFDKIYSSDQDFLIQALPNEFHKRHVNHESSYANETPDLTNHSVKNDRVPLGQTRQTNTLIKSTNGSDKDVNLHDSIGRVSPDETSLFHSVFASKWILVFLAATVNVLYFLELQHIYGKTILAPFLALILVRLHLDDNKSGSQSGNMVSTALILCNIKPALVYNLKWMTRLLKKITQEFAIYIFSFVLLYMAVCSQWNNIDIPVSLNNMQLQ